MANSVEKKKFNNNLMWWKVDPDELNNQIVNYHTLGFFSSSRKISAALLVLSACATWGFIVGGLVGPVALVDCGLFLILAGVISQGHRWAAVCAMILWSVEKLGMLPSQHGMGAVVQIIWWALYMKSFFLTYKVGHNPRLPESPPTDVDAPKTA